jgi:hypothetical protein
MDIVVVSYDLRNGREYDRIIGRLEELQAVRALKSLWLLRSSHKSEAIHDDLRRYIDADDGLFVARLAEAPAWTRPEPEAKKFLGSPQNMLVQAIINAGLTKRV